MPYRVYLLQDGRIRGAHTFMAQHDDEARQLADVFFQCACDEFEGHELWCGPRQVHSLTREALPPIPLDLSTLSRRRQAALVELDQAMRAAFPAVRKSRLLLARLDELRVLIEGHGAAGKLN